jgi:hypothetical protein
MSVYMPVEPVVALDAMQEALEVHAHELAEYCASNPQAKHNARDLKRAELLRYAAHCLRECADAWEDAGEA